MAGAHTCCPLGRQIGSPQEAREANLLPFSSKRDSQAVPGGQGTTKAQEGFGREGSQSHRARLCTAPAPAPRPRQPVSKHSPGFTRCCQAAVWMEGRTFSAVPLAVAQPRAQRPRLRTWDEAVPATRPTQPSLCERWFSAARAFSWLPPRSPHWGHEHRGPNPWLRGHRPHGRVHPTFRGAPPPSVPTLLPRRRDHGRPPQPRVLQETPPATQGPPPHAARRAHWLQAGDGRQACVVARPRPCILSRRASGRGSQQHAGPQPCCKVLTHTEHSLSPRTLLAPSSSCADILIVLLWELAGGLSSGMARRGARAGCWRWLLPREAAHSDRLSNNLNLLRRACGTAAGPLYLLH